MFRFCNFKFKTITEHFFFGSSSISTQSFPFIIFERKIRIYAKIFNRNVAFSICFYVFRTGYKIQTENAQTTGSLLSCGNGIDRFQQ